MEQQINAMQNEQHKNSFFDSSTNCFNNANAMFKDGTPTRVRSICIIIKAMT
jgi:hypothetical protein